MKSSVMMAKLEWKENKFESCTNQEGCLNAVNLRGAQVFAWEDQVVVWMPVWGARRVPHYLLVPTVCREWVLLREEFLEKNQVPAKEECRKWFLKALEGMGEVLERMVVMYRRDPQVSN